MAKRRPKGSGSIWESADGSWTAQLELGVVDGQRRRKRFHGATRPEVARRLEAARRSRSDGLTPAPERLTVGTYLTRWLADSAAVSVRPSTLAGYEMTVRVHLSPGLGTIRLGLLAPSDVQAYLRTRLDRGLSARTARHHLAILRTALSQAMRWGLVGRNVASLVTPPRLVEVPIQPLNAIEARSLIDAVSEDRLAAAYAVALTTGLRRGELLGLSWSDVDLEARTLIVRQALQRIRGQFVLVEPKTVRSRRTLPLPTLAVASLREHRRRQALEQLAAGDRWAGHELVFTTPLGDPVHGADLVHGLHRHLAAAGLRSVSFHSLRHAAASFLLDQGVDLKMVSEILGHSTIALTANTYGHLTDRAKRAAMDTFDEVLG